MNQVMMIGTVVSEVTKELTKDDKSLVKFTLRSNLGHKPLQIECVAFQLIANHIYETIHKYDMIGFTGRISQRGKTYEIIIDRIGLAVENSMLEEALTDGSS